MQEVQVQSLGQEDPLEKEMATHSNILAWEIPRTEEPDRPQSTGSQRVGHNLATKKQPTFWRRGSSYPHFADGETEAQGVKIIRPRSQSCNLDLNPAKPVWLLFLFLA